MSGAFEVIRDSFRQFQTPVDVSLGGAGGQELLGPTDQALPSVRGEAFEVVADNWHETAAEQFVGGKGKQKGLEGVEKAVTDAIVGEEGGTDEFGEDEVHAVEVNRAVLENRFAEEVGLVVFEEKDAVGVLVDTREAEDGVVVLEDDLPGQLGDHQEVHEGEFGVQFGEGGEEEGPQTGPGAAGHALEDDHRGHLPDVLQERLEGGQDGVSTALSMDVEAEGPVVAGTLLLGEAEATVKGEEGVPRGDQRPLDHFGLHVHQQGVGHRLGHSLGPIMEELSDQSLPRTALPEGLVSQVLDDSGAQLDAALSNQQEHRHGFGKPGTSHP